VCTHVCMYVGTNFLSVPNSQSLLTEPSVTKCDTKTKLLFVTKTPLWPSDINISRGFKAKIQKEECTMFDTIK
jgi:hypothetical protein